MLRVFLGVAHVRTVHCRRNTQFNVATGGLEEVEAKVTCGLYWTRHVGVAGGS